ncbi:DnaB-like helicase C-terminal domain-containing protein [Kaistia algarum]|uniref:DnaB-like helicase C-terminal domain-containing protein n=1 Tax=Kaistia algarum TaxID=2083279 RepID=UPI001056EC5E|nr:DnaB-like helicase C-terminal domain-containing protein [Kaistia algarum]MCX5516213.1 replicative DNA helicase [Kaistia algarum]
MNAHALPEPRPLPQNIEAEQALLGAILVNNKAFDRVAGFLEADHFIEPLHGQIYDVAAKLIRSERIANPVTMRHFMPPDLAVGELNAAQYLARLAAEATTVINAEDFGRAIYDLAVRRSLIKIGDDVVNIAYDAPADLNPAEQIARATGRLEALSGVAENVDPAAVSITLKDAVVKALQHASAAAANGNSAAGITTGLVDLDRMTGGFAPGDLILVGGRPSMGKSALAGCLARAAARSGIGAGIASLEMSDVSLTTRMLTDEAFDHVGSIAYEQVAKGHYGSHLGAIETASFELAKLPVLIHDRGGLSITGITTLARSWERAFKRDGCNLGILIVDYLQLVRPADRYRGDRNNEVSEVSAGLKGLAKSLGIAVVALSQLSRNCETREDKRPMLSDLRDSGSLEQDADKVIFLYRDHYYLKKQKADTIEDQAMLEHTENQLEAIVAKNRMGPTGTVKLFIDLPASAIRNLKIESMF